MITRATNVVELVEKWRKEAMATLNQKFVANSDYDTAHTQLDCADELEAATFQQRIDPDSGRHGPNENRHDVLKALGGSLADMYPLYEMWRFELLAKDRL